MGQVCCLLHKRVAPEQHNAAQYTGADVRQNLVSGPWSAALPKPQALT